MGNACFSGNKDRVEKKVENPGQEGKSVEEAKPDLVEKPVTSEEKPPPEEEKPVLAPAAVDMAGDHGNIHIINSMAAWKAKLEEAKTSGKVVIVDFTATWCGPCRLMAPLFTELSKKYENLIFLKVDVDEVQDVAAEWDVRAMPTFLFIKDGKKLEKIVGSNKEDLEKKCSQYNATTS